MIMWTKKHWKKIIAVVGIISLVFLIIPIAVNIIIGSDFNPTPIELNGSTSDELNPKSWTKESLKNVRQSKKKVCQA